MAKRHFLQQAHKMDYRKHQIAGAWASEKLDGQRAYWDGGIFRGVPKRQVPFANNTNDSRYLVPPVATGLWSRYGNVIHAPDWFLDLLPPYPIDGELWVGRGEHQTTRKIISPLLPNELAWRKVKFVVFDTPTYTEVFYDSVIDIPNYYKRLDGVRQQLPKDHIDNRLPYHERYSFLELSLPQCDNLQLIVQRTITRRDDLESYISEVMQLGGEGVVVRRPVAIYKCERDHSIAKLKPYHDSEATVIGYVTGRETDKGSKLLGLMGALIVEWRGKRFELSGFTDQERTLTYIPSRFGEAPTLPDQRMTAYKWACDNPETKCGSEIEAIHFPRGSKVTFKYRELTDAGVPKEAAYLRKWEAV